MVATALKAGSLAVIHINSDDPGGTRADTISFVLLKPTGSGTVIYFTDRTWTPTTGSTALNAGSFSTSGTDGTFAYMAGADLPAGTIINISTAQLANAGINISDLGEALYVYQGTDANTPTSFLYAVELGDGNTTFNASLTNTGLTPGVHTVALAGDNVSYGDRGHNINIPSCSSASAIRKTGRSTTTARTCRSPPPATSSARPTRSSSPPIRARAGSAASTATARTPPYSSTPPMKIRRTSRRSSTTRTTSSSTRCTACSSSPIRIRATAASCRATSPT
jgi:hypothetical protein